VYRTKLTISVFKKATPAKTKSRAGLNALC